MTRIPVATASQVSEKSQDMLNAVEKKLGMVPNMFGTMAHSETTLQSYLTLSEIVGGGELTAQQREMIALATAQKNSCQYCLAAHSTVGKMVGLTEEQTIAARQGMAIDPVDAAIVKLAGSIVSKQGKLSDEDVSEARGAGLSESQIMEITTNVALNIFTNYFNHIADPEVDFPPAPEVPTSCSTESCGCAV